jgi:hypothetical protein
MIRSSADKAQTADATEKRSSALCTTMRQPPRDEMGF